MMKYFISFIALLSFIIIYSCRETVQDKIDYTNKLRTIEFQKFKLSVPGRWERFYLKDSDSIEASLTNGTDTIWLKYAQVVSELDENEIGFVVYKDQIVDGFPARLSLPQQVEDKRIRLLIDGFKDGKKLFAEGKSAQHGNRILEIFSTLKFPDGNGNTDIAFSADVPVQSEGRAFFTANCAPCHHPLKKSTGPALREVMQIRTEKWVFTFLSSEKFKAKDSISLALQKEYGVSCIKFPHITRSEVSLLYKYVLSYKLSYLPGDVVSCP